MPTNKNRHRAKSSKTMKAAQLFRISWDNPNNTLEKAEEADEKPVFYVLAFDRM
jgi:hypothetical protein